MRRRGAGSQGRRVVAALALLACVSAPLRLCAQTIDTVPKPHIPTTVRVGKWLALGGAIALGYRANALHQDANDSYQALQDRCFEFPDACSLTPGGTYSDPVSEQLYTTTQDNDHQASRALIGAEVSFALAAVGFVWELLERRDRTPNIPFEPRVESGMTSTRIGVTIRF